MKSAFTLIELLVVIILLAFIISMVAPAGSRMYDGFLRYIDIKERDDKFKGLKFDSFLTQKENYENNISMIGADYTQAKKSSDND